MAVAYEIVTPEQLQAMPDGENFELVNGELVERKMGSKSSLVAVTLGAILLSYARSTKSGWVFDSELGYRCFPDAPNQVRRPDVSFVAKGRIASGELPEGWFPIAPDLAVEVISPNDLAAEVVDKIDKYLCAGVKLVWVVYPESMLIHVFRPDGSANVLRSADELNGESALPGFSCSVAEVFSDLKM